jgi:chemotaxis methyl-accepting protein methylase
MGLAGGEAVTYDRFLQEACEPLDLAWRKYRRRSARHRVEQRLGELGLPDMAAYLERLRDDPTEAAGLADLMRVTVSRLFREEERWKALAERILPALLAARPAGLFRAWSVGCCGGEEPYSLALVWMESLEPRYPGSTIEITATDIDAASLERARLARYEAGSLRELPTELRSRWFAREGNLLRLDMRVTRLVRFERRNLMIDPVPAGMDLVMCRYLAFTYYRGERLLAAVRRLWEALRPGGVLMIGRKEGLPPDALELFTPWPGCAGFFVRQG